MEQINCYAIYHLGSTLRDCVNSAHLPVKHWISSATTGRDQIDAMLRGDSKFRFDESREAATTLRNQLEATINGHKADGEYVLENVLVGVVSFAIWRFNEALAVELGRAPIFLVMPKGVFDTRRLIANADAVFDGFADRLPAETLADTREAGRCLAFSLYTAAGFHIARATESVIKKYMEAYGCGPQRESQRNWGAYTKALTGKNANAIIIHHIDQLRQLHRNPITHPEVRLTQAEAMALHAMCQSVIHAMVGDMEGKRPSPDATIAAMLPTPNQINALGWGQDESPPASAQVN